MGIKIVDFFDKITASVLVDRVLFIVDKRALHSLNLEIASHTVHVKLLNILLLSVFGNNVA